MQNGLDNKSFRHLNKLLREHDISIEEMPAMRLASDHQTPMSPQEEEALFRDAMADVNPLSGAQKTEPRPRRPQAKRHPKEEDDVLTSLQHLIEHGRGYRVADTPEYIEGQGFAVPKEMVRRLHQGTYAIQGHIDLHGMCVEEAREVVDNLLSKAVKQGLRMVLIIHGRGLCSPGNPVLKSRLEQWLRRGLWRKWILAYSSARACDGGAGATYVLLRSRPMTKRRRKRLMRENEHIK